VETNEEIAVLIMKYFFCCDRLYWTTLVKVKCPICHREHRTKFIDMPKEAFSDHTRLVYYEFNILGVPKHLKEYDYVKRHLFNKNDLKPYLS